MGLQKRHGCQKMRLILKFCVEILKYLLSKFSDELWSIYKKSVFAFFLRL
jgi:hypothetical protein